MGIINLDDIIFSDEILNDWGDSKLFEKIKNHERFINPLDI